MSDFCDAEHDNATYGCYGLPHHDGRHWSHSDYVKDHTGQRENEHGNMIWEWDNEAPEVPAGSATLVLTDTEISVMLASLVGLEAVIPGLAKPILAKLDAARAGLQK